MNKSSFESFLIECNLEKKIGQITNDLNNLIIQNENTNIDSKVKKIPKLFDLLSFNLGNDSYKIQSDKSINLNDIIGQLYHLSSNNFLKQESFKIFTKKNISYLYFNTEFIGAWKSNEVHYLKGKILSILICKFHNKIEIKWSGFLHGSIISKNNNSFLIVGKSGSGKTSLATLLTKNEYNLICDDIAPLGEDCYFGHFPNALSLKDNNKIISKNFIVDQFKTYTTKTVKGDITYLYPKHNQVLKKKILNKTIIRIKYLKNSKLIVSKSSKTEVLQEFINDSYIPRNNKSIKNFIGWFKQCNMFDLTYSDSEDIIDFLNSN